MNPKRLLRRLRQGAFQNVAFGDAQRLAEALGFELSRIRGDHHIYGHPAMSEQLNLQPRRGEAKAYQVRQLLDLVEQYDLDLED